MKNKIELIVTFLTVMALAAGGFIFVEDRVCAKTKEAEEKIDKVEKKVIERIKETKEEVKEKNEKQDDELDTLKEFSIKQTVLMESITDKLKEVTEELKK